MFADKFITFFLKACGGGFYDLVEREIFILMSGSYCFTTFRCYSYSAEARCLGVCAGQCV